MAPWRVALGLTLLALGAAVGFVIVRLPGLGPLLRQAWPAWGGEIAFEAAVLAALLYCGFFGLLRRLGLADMGRKVRTLDRQMRDQAAPDRELADRLRADEAGERR